MPHCARTVRRRPLPSVDAMRHVDVRRRAVSEVWTGLNAGHDNACPDRKKENTAIN